MIGVNKTFAEKLGFSQEQMIGMRTLDFVADPFKSVALAENKTPSGQPYELLLRNRDGSLMLMECFSANVVRQSDRVLICSFRNISARLTRVRLTIDLLEKERSRLGRHLHEHLSQTLAGASWSMQSFIQELEQVDGKAPLAAHRVRRAIDSALEEFRSLSREFSPLRLDAMDPASLLNVVVHDIEARWQFRCEIEPSDRASRFHPDTALHLYRITEDVVQSMLEQEDCSRVLLRLNRLSRIFELTISATAPKLSANAAGKLEEGLRAASYRARLINAHSAISTVGKCMVGVKISFPTAGNADALSTAVASSD